MTYNNLKNKASSIEDWCLWNLQFRRFLDNIQLIEREIKSLELPW